MNLVLYVEKSTYQDIKLMKDGKIEAIKKTIYVLEEGMKH